MDKAKAQKIFDATTAKVKVLQDEEAALTGKDNKKARNAKSREAADLKKDPDYVDAERVLADKEPLQDKNKTSANTKAPTPKMEVPIIPASAGGYAAPVALSSKDKKKKEGKAEGGGISAAERAELDKLKTDVVTRKTALKAEGMTGGQMNKDPEVVTMVKRMTELKEKAGESTGKEAKKELKTKAKGDAEAMDKLKQEIESYKEKLKTEFGYTKADINKDEDILEMTKRLKTMK